MFLADRALDRMKFIFSATRFFAGRARLVGCLALIALLMPNSLFASAASQPIPTEQAFVFSATATDSQNIVAHWRITPGYYLYRDRISFKPQNPREVTLGKPVFPEGIAKQDAELGKYQVYQNQVDITVPLIKPNTGDVSLIVTYQGCAAAGFCYPPVTKSFTLNLSANYHQPTSGALITGSHPLVPATLQHSYVSQQEHVTKILANGSLTLIIFTCLGFGLLLSFTPCVLPLIPILSGVIIGHDKPVSTGKAFRLSLVYVLSMSLTYAVAGLLIGWLGSNLQVVLQKPWVLGLFSLVFVWLALSLFGLYELQLPKGLQAFLARISHKQKSSHYIGVAIMGCLATLIVSPCVTPPLIGILSYIAHSGSPLLGAIALFSLSFGMGIPLLLIGTSGGKLLPKAGPWMNSIKIILGVMLLGIAIWMLGRILPGPVALFMWAALLIICAVYLGALSSAPSTGWEKLWKGSGLIMLIYGILLVLGAARGSSDPFRPLAGAGFSTSSFAASAELPFHKVQTFSQLQQTLALAAQQNRPVLLDFYADWCIACKIMAKETFADPRVQQALAHFILLQANVTDNNVDDQALLQQLGVVAPPTVLFYQPTGKELSDLRVVGEMEPEQFLKVIEQVGG